MSHALRRRHALFLAFDRNHTGALDWEDFHHAAEVIRDERLYHDDHPRYVALLGAMREWWDELSRRVDRDGDGRVTAAEWTQFFASLADEVRALGRAPLWALGFLQALFAVLDADGGDSITAEEYGLWLRAVGSPHDADAAFARLDTDGDGTVDFDELEGLFTQWLLDEDDASPGASLFLGGPR